jgi:hypothetical protein
MPSATCVFEPKEGEESSASKGESRVGAGIQVVDDANKISQRRGSRDPLESIQRLILQELSRCFFVNPLPLPLMPFRLQRLPNA